MATPKPKPKVTSTTKKFTVKSKGTPEGPMYNPNARPKPKVGGNTRNLKT